MLGAKDDVTGSAAEFKLANAWLLSGKGLHDSDSWICEDINFTLNETDYSLAFTGSSDHKTLTLNYNGSTPPAAGTYSDVTLKMVVSNSGTGGTALSFLAAGDRQW